MPDHPEAFEHMLAAWNEADPEKIRGHLEKALADGVDFCDPQHHVQGLDAFETMVRNFRRDIPAARCLRTSGLDAHHDRVRYHWVVQDGDTPLLEGMDVTTVDADGRVLRVDGFFGAPPAAD